MLTSAYEGTSKKRKHVFTHIVLYYEALYYTEGRLDRYHIGISSQA